ncbi:MAG: hypothetical protein P8099_01175 [Gemmatimonadota bacterium]
MGDESCGSMQLVQGGSWQSGIVTHVSYSLAVSDIDGNPFLNASVAGIAVKGMVVLNGTVDSGAYDGQTIHPLGEIQTSGNPDNLEATMLGAIMLNPQPEPPSTEFPPSPCAPAQ